MDTPRPVVFLHYWLRRIWDKRHARTGCSCVDLNWRVSLLVEKPDWEQVGKEVSQKRTACQMKVSLGKPQFQLLLFNSLNDSRETALESRVWGLYSLYSLLFLFSFALYNSSEAQSNTLTVTVCGTHSFTVSLVSLFPNTPSNATKNVEHLLSALAKLSHHFLF